jgi:hypothetical protein
VDRREAVQECLHRAAEARHIAEASASPAEKADWLRIEQHWRELAHRYQSREKG